MPTRYDWVLAVNPAAPFIRCWSQILDEGRVPDLYLLGMATGWAVLLFVGSSLFFMSRERELAVRL